MTLLLVALGVAGLDTIWSNYSWCFFVGSIAGDKSVSNVYRLVTSASKAYCVGGLADDAATKFLILPF